ncbi:hypothetical protein KFL_002170180 [Klebsormidium nitens]|uniref:Uncharacterized protein n=1 Tax=Klebsormidium nitens TaxID=105231 RepID=A0A1Y1I284_KLENI|nr:hypothetical protein KFL_002170180 [Klebsormidium nitens]|eukprot:GAQ85024.1 hypothetical protein KFL_002170180 [Klebsormidium nitens]
MGGGSKNALMDGVGHQGGPASGADEGKGAPEGQEGRRDSGSSELEEGEIPTESDGGFEGADGLENASGEQSLNDVGAEPDEGDASTVLETDIEAKSPSNEQETGAGDGDEEDADGGGAERDVRCAAVSGGDAVADVNSQGGDVQDERGQAPEAAAAGSDVTQADVLSRLSLTPAVEQSPPSPPGSMPSGTVPPQMSLKSGDSEESAGDRDPWSGDSADPFAHRDFNSDAGAPFLPGMSNSTPPRKSRRSSMGAGKENASPAQDGSDGRKTGSDGGPVTPGGFHAGTSPNKSSPLVQKTTPRPPGSDSAKRGSRRQSLTHPPSGTASDPEVKPGAGFWRQLLALNQQRAEWNGEWEQMMRKASSFFARVPEPEFWAGKEAGGSPAMCAGGEETECAQELGSDGGERPREAPAKLTGGTGGEVLGEARARAMTDKEGVRMATSATDDAPTETRESQTEDAALVKDKTGGMPGRTKQTLTRGGQEAGGEMAAGTGKDAPGRKAGSKGAPGEQPAVGGPGSAMPGEVVAVKPKTKQAGNGAPGKQPVKRTTGIKLTNRALVKIPALKASAGGAKDSARKKTQGGGAGKSGPLKRGEMPRGRLGKEATGEAALAGTGEATKAAGKKAMGTIKSGEIGGEKARAAGETVSNRLAIPVGVGQTENEPGNPGERTLGDEAARANGNRALVLEPRAPGKAGAKSLGDHAARGSNDRAVDALPVALGNEAQRPGLDAARAIGDRALMALPPVRIAPTPGSASTDRDLLEAAPGSGQPGSGATGSSGLLSPMTPPTWEQSKLWARSEGAHGYFYAAGVSFADPFQASLSVFCLIQYRGGRANLHYGCAGAPAEEGNELTGSVVSMDKEKTEQLGREFHEGLRVPLDPWSREFLGPRLYTVKECGDTFNTVCNDICMLLAESEPTAKKRLLRLVAEAAKESFMPNDWRRDFSDTAKSCFDRNSKGQYVRCPDTLFHGSRNVRHLHAHHRYLELLLKAEPFYLSEYFTWGETWARNLLEGRRLPSFMYRLYFKLKPADVKPEVQSSLSRRQSPTLHAAVVRLEDTANHGVFSDYVDFLRMQKFEDSDMEPTWA